jgi:antitoxin CptB
MGSNENDILFGGFAEKHLAQLTPEQVDRFEALLAEHDTDLFDWATAKRPPASDIDHDVMAMIIDYVANGKNPS